MVAQDSADANRGKTSAPSQRAVIIIYRYWSGIYHFFDSFWECGKRSGIGMVLVFDCFDCLGRGGWRSFPSKINENCVQKLAKCSNLAQTRSKLGKHVTITSSPLHMWRAVRFVGKLRRF